MSTEWSTRPPHRELLSKLWKDSALDVLLQVEAPDPSCKGLRHVFLVKLTKAHSCSSSGRTCEAAIAGADSKLAKTLIQKMKPDLHFCTVVPSKCTVKPLSGCKRLSHISRFRLLSKPLFLSL